MKEKLELVQKARLGLGYDSEATVLNRCVVFHAKPGTPLDHEELEPDCQIAYHSVSARLAYLSADRPDIAFPCKECSRAVGRATRAELSQRQKEERREGRQASAMRDERQREYERESV